MRSEKREDTRAKQSQFVLPDNRRAWSTLQFRGERGRSPYCAKQSQFGARRMSANCRSGKGLEEKQWTRASRETKPIRGRRQGRDGLATNRLTAALQTGPAVPNKANFRTGHGERGVRSVE
jgi:hypothetical protein